MSEPWMRPRYSRLTGQEGMGIYACGHCPLDTLSLTFCETCGGRICVDCKPCGPQPWQHGIGAAVSRMLEHLERRDPKVPHIKFDARDRLALRYILDELERRARAIAMLEAKIATSPVRGASR